MQLLAVSQMCLCQVDFQDAEARTVAERRRQEERQRRREAMYRERVGAAAKDMEGEHQLAASTLLFLSHFLNRVSF